MLEKSVNGSPPAAVCHVSLSLETGGLERLLVEFARFHGPDFVPFFVALESAGRPARDIRGFGLDVVELGRRGEPKLSRLARLVSVLRERHVRLVHTHNDAPHLYGTVAAKLARVPVVVHSRHSTRFGNGASERVRFGLLAHAADTIVAVSDDVADRCRHAGGPGLRVRRIWNGVDIRRFPFRGPAARPLAIAVSRLSAEKDTATLLRAAHQVVRDVEDFELLVIGDGPERANLERQRDDLGLRESVTFLGERHDVADLYAQAAIFVASSLTEGTSLTVLEAMASGLPVVTTDVGGNPELVAAGETGLLVPPRRPDALAAALRELCRDDKRRVEMGKAGRRRVEKWFDVRDMVGRYEALYSELLRT